MFLQTYGLLYERNSYIFTEMFHELEKYYISGGVDLNQVLDYFFHRLYSKMFQVLNAQYTFDTNYLKCVSEKMEELKPFGDIPKKLKIEVKRSFVATRTFVQSVMSGVEVLQKVEDISVTNDCSRALDNYKFLMEKIPSQSASSFSSHYSSNDQVPLCNAICSSLLSRCLSLHHELNHEWTNYVDSLILLSSRLETSFNIESVVDPIDIKISEAIMNFQENGMQVSQKVCHHLHSSSLLSPSFFLSLDFFFHFLHIFLPPQFGLLTFFIMLKSPFDSILLNFSPFSQKERERRENFLCMSSSYFFQRDEFIHSFWFHFQITVIRWFSETPRGQKISSLNQNFH